MLTCDDDQKAEKKQDDLRAIDNEMRNDFMMRIAPK
jgi:hypothetical protein